MKTAIIYLSKHGTTEKVARKIQSKLSETDITLIDFNKNNQPELTSFERIIIGVSVYAGSVDKKLTKFCLNNESTLNTKELGLFVCGMEPSPEKQQLELESAFPESLRTSSKSVGFMGGEFLFEKMNFLEKLIVKKIAHVTESTSKIKEDAIESFVQRF